MGIIFVYVDKYFIESQTESNIKPGLREDSAETLDTITLNVHVWERLKMWR
jgi:hypothetical protein